MRRRIAMWLLALASLGLFGASVPTAGAASSPSVASVTAAAATPTPSVASVTAAGATPAPSVASVTAATTGLPNPSSVVALNACGSPTALVAACLARVLGIRSTRAFVHPRLSQPASPNRLSRRRRTSATPTLAIPAAAPPQPGTPAYLQQAYDLAALSQTAGGGATIAIVDAFDAPTAEADMAVYRSKFGLPPCTTGNGCFRKLDENGGQNYPPTSLAWRIEISMDLDAVSALCPNCHIVLVEANTANPSDLGAAQATAGALPGVSVISDSWAVALSSSTDVQTFESYGPYTFQGITTVAASGDNGYLGAQTNDYPAALGGVAAAGGTTLVPASSSHVLSPRGFSESAWSGAGSGCALPVTKPPWQTDTGCGGRSYADLSADADPDTGMQVYDSYPNDGGWLVVGGTSEASPLIAAYYALVGSATQGPSWAYANSSLLNDPTSGSNAGASGSCARPIVYICNAGPGYDGPTGVGSISGAVIAGGPGIGGPGPNNSYTQSVTADTALLQGGVYPNSIDTTYWWEYGTTTGYGQQSPAKDIGAGSAALAVTDTLTGLQPSTTYHYRLVAKNSFGTEYGYDYTLLTAAATTTTSGQNPGTTGTTPTPPPTPPPTTPSTVPLNTPSARTTTPPTAAPTLTKLRVASAGATTATISATVSTGAAGTYTLQYGTTRALGRHAAGPLAASATGLVRTLRNLAPGRTYYLRAVVSNASGSSTSPTIRFRTSAVTITRLAIRGHQLQAVLRCHGSAACRVRLQARSGSRVVAVGRATVRGNRSATVTVTLSRAFTTAHASGRTQTVKLSALSSWNGYPATVTAAISFR